LEIRYRSVGRDTLLKSWPLMAAIEAIKDLPVFIFAKYREPSPDSYAII
jgi:hypothetical protein